MNQRERREMAEFGYIEVGLDRAVKILKITKTKFAEEIGKSRQALNHYRTHGRMITIYKNGNVKIVKPAVTEAAFMHMGDFDG